MSLECQHVSRAFIDGSARARVVRDASLTVHKGELVAIVGPSGSGKTTLLRMMGCLLEPTSGAITLGGESLPTPSRGASFRNGHIGFVFQDFALIEDESAEFNVEVPMRYRRSGRLRRGARRARARELLDSLGIDGDVARRRVGTLSGGERQRVAIARAMANEPDLVLADEPTGALDEANAAAIVGLLRQTAEHGCAVVVVTHDEDVAAAADRIMRMTHGRLDPPVVP